jgi:ABC-2 type transport system permease protein
MAALAPLRTHADLYVNLTLRELRGKYKRSLLGWGWSLVNPIATTAIFTFVFSYILKVDPPTGDPSGIHVFAIFLLCGILPWNLLANGLTGGMGALLGNANLIKKVYFPRALLVGASTSSLAITMLIELSVLAGVLLGTGHMVLQWLPVVVLVVLLETLFVFGLAMLLAVVAVYFRDMEHLIGILLQIWFYATPIIYPITKATEALAEHPTVLWFYEANPMTRFAAIYRDLLYNLRGPRLVDVLAVIGATVVSLAIGATVFRRLEPRLAEEM